MALLVATLAASVAVVVTQAGRGEAATLTSPDGYTQLSTTGAVTAGTPYSSGQQVTVTVIANSTLSAANLHTAGLPGCNSATDCSGNLYVEECTDPGGDPAQLPTSSTGCEATTLNAFSARNLDGSGTLAGTRAFTIYDLPDTNLGPPTMTGSCDVSPNQCVLGIFAANPGSQNGFAYPHLFSAPYNVTSGDGLDLGDNPGDGSAPVIVSTSPTKSSLTANTGSVAADGVNKATLTVSLKDTNGNPVTSGKSVTLSQGSGSSTIAVSGTAGSTATTDAGGQAQFTVTDHNAETVTYTATDTTDSVAVTQTAAVTFAAPVTSASNSAISALSANVPASGSTTITVTLNDQGGIPQPISGKVVSLTQGTGSSLITPASSGSATTNAQGKATFTVSDTKSETVAYSATDTTDSIPLTGQSVSVTFGTLTVSATDSTVTTSTPIVSSVNPGTGQPAGTVTVTLLSGRSPVAGKSVTVSTTSHATVTPTSQTTDANGEASFSVTDTTVETATFSAVDTTDSNLAIAATAQVSFQEPAASASTSSITVLPSVVPADGTTRAALTVTIEDQFGSPLANKTVTVAGTVTGTSNASQTVKVIPSTQTGGTLDTTTNGNGQITFNTDDTTAESVTYTATDSTDNVTVTQTVAVTFTAGLPQVSQSTVQAAPTSVPADGSTASTITVTLEDHNANPVPGVSLTMAALNGSSSVAPASGTVTNASGRATFTVTDKTAENVLYRVTDTTDNLPLVGEEVQVTFGTPPPTAPNLANSDIVASSTSVPADGHSSATVQVILNDGNGLPLTGKSVTVVPGSASAVVSPAQVTTNSNGVAAFTVTDPTVETVTFTATDITDNTPLSGLSVSISFTPAVATSATAGHPSHPIVGMAATPDGKGYWLVASDGGIFSYGDAAFFGSTGSIVLNKPIVGMAATPDGKGYWLVASDGGIFSYGDAAFFGSTGSIVLNKPIVGMAATPDGKGYWLVASDGGIFSYGDAAFFGSTGSIVLNKPIVGMAATPDGKGYWLVASDGGIFSYGDAAFFGSTGSIVLNKPIVGMAATPDGKGYWLVASDGGIFSYGDAAFFGSTGSIVLNKPIVGVASTPDGQGYWIAASDGGVFTEGDAVFRGSLSG